MHTAVTVEVDEVLVAEVDVSVVDAVAAVTDVAHVAHGGRPPPFHPAPPPGRGQITPPSWLELSQRCYVQGLVSSRLAA